MELHDVLIRPIVTEKTMEMMAEKKYAFVVDRNATKTQIKNAVENIFGVKVEKVYTANRIGKVKRVGRFEGRRPDWKRAIVKLTADSKGIEFFEGLM
ncbi:50S ribosomal protein L23 [Calorimonas adulescens]|uniref:Large ribosomal subunit protein uL23 n=1 Tax=Calorimonas adulescens TaxID=2606906 RepID=A0A5D8QDZ3_9THEO|nr:50S ribosomal protein L23 [Calorimonas adulescens]TZE82722.1 50S ribosomal protein L23 [Calorimonas adulescens]